MQGSALAFGNIYQRTILNLGVRRMDLQLRAVDGRIQHIKNTILELQTKLEEAKAVEDTPKALKEKLASDLRAAEKHLQMTMREVRSTILKLHQIFVILIVRIVQL
jgi:hypothetical protein